MQSFPEVRVEQDKRTTEVLIILKAEGYEKGMKRTREEQIGL